jgi:uncharacterized membrane protein
VHEDGRGVDVLGVLRAVAMTVILCFLPGYAWMRVTMPEVRGIARFTISIVLSLAMVVLALYMGSYLLDARVSGAHAVLDALAISLAAVAFRLRHSLPDRLARIS